MNTTVILWLWPVAVLGALVAFGLFLRRTDSSANGEGHHRAAE